MIGGRRIGLRDLFITEEKWDEASACEWMAGTLAPLWKVYPHRQPTSPPKQMTIKNLKCPAATPPLENRDGESHYFAPTRAKVRGAVQFCEKRRMFFKHLTFLVGKNGSFCAIMLHQGGSTMNAK